MTNPVVQKLLDGIELRERQLAEQVGELAARLRELEAEREALAITGKTIRAMAPDLASPPAPPLPDGAAYQQIMDVFGHERRALRARDLCQALDLPVMPKHVEGTRAKLNAWSPSDSSRRANPDCSHSHAQASADETRMALRSLTRWAQQRILRRISPTAAISARS